jgi:hypothetical protein
MKNHHEKLGPMHEEKVQDKQTAIGQVLGMHSQHTHTQIFSLHFVLAGFPDQDNNSDHAKLLWKQPS